MGEIKIINHGMLTLIQDGGRYGYQQFGVPVSGVMDSFSHRVGNILVGNDENEAVIEVTMLGPQIEFQEDSVIAITGGDLSPSINGKTIEMWKSVYVKFGDILSFGAIKKGCRSYIALAGGIDIPLVMGSKSTYVKASIGGYKGRPLKGGDVIQIGKTKEVLSKLKDRYIPKKFIPEYINDFDVRVVLGPQEDYFTSKGMETFFSNKYVVTNECDRMGFRLDGESIEHIGGGDIISDGISFGAIQIPGHGKPIIMMADRQTTGGYTKIGNIIWVDLCKVAQAKPGDKIGFKEITIEHAHEELENMERTIAEIKKSFINREIISTREFKIKVNGHYFDVKVEEVR